MITLRHAFTSMSTILVLSIFLVACGGIQTPTPKTSASTTGTNYQVPGNTNATTPTAPAAQPTMGAQATPTASNTMTPDNGNKNAFIRTAFVTLNGKKVQVLTNTKGFVLYYYLKDTMLASKCTGACAQDWPAVLASKGMMTISTSVTLPHKLAIHMTANGNQIFYDGHPLYSYAGDMQAGQFNGRGMASAWYLVGVNL